MDRREYTIPGLELGEIRDVEACARETWGDPGTLETPPIDGLGKLVIWQREPECVSLSRLACMVHADGIDPSSPMGMLLERLAAARQS